MTENETESEYWLSEWHSAHQVETDCVRAYISGRNRSGSTIDLAEYWAEKSTQAMGEFFASCSV